MNNKFPLFHINIRVIAAYLLSVVLSMSIFSVYDVPVLSIWSLLVIVVCGGIFILCRSFNYSTFMGKLCMVLFIALDLVVFMRLSIGGSNRNEFLQWFFLSGDRVSVRVSFLLAMLAGFTVFFALTVYYFTNVLYRMPILTAISFIPCVLYVKVFEEIDNIYLILIVVCNLACFMLRSYNSGGDKTRVIGLKSMGLSFGGFIFVVLILASAIPKESEAKYYNKFTSFFANQNTNISLGENYTGLNDVSGNADNFQGFNDRRMYTIYGDYVPYFKRQSFDYYDFDKDNWLPDDNYSIQLDSLDKWKRENVMLNLIALKSAIIRANDYSPGFAEKYGLTEVVQDTELKDDAKNIYIQANNFGAVYYLNTARGFDIALRGDDADIGVTESGAYRNERGISHPRSLVYQITVYDEITGRQQWIDLGGSSFNYENSFEMLRELRNVLNANDDNFVYVAETFWRNQLNANIYRQVCAENNDKISRDVRELALNITNDCTYDWEKAEKLQNYFTDNGFIYDLEYTAKDTSPEYFLFKSKRGTCSDFASAYVLMARAAGLTVRYVEGYAPQETFDENVYTISDRNAHAYPEVFIQNIGWLVYEPTVASQYNNFNEGDFWQKLKGLKPDTRLLVEVLFTAVFALFIFCIVFFVMPYIEEKVFIYKILQADERQCIIMVYDRISRKTLKGIIPNVKSLTPYELAQELKTTIGCDMLPLAVAAEEVVYGGKSSDITNIRIRELYISIKQAARQYKKKKG